jgi:hypothetical protein
MSPAAVSAAQEQFTACLPAVETAARFAFRRRIRLRRQDYEEARAEAFAAAWSAWIGLLRKGKNPIQVGVHGIANNVIRHVKNGRRIGNLHRGRSARDVHHRKAQTAGGYTIQSLDSNGQPAPLTHGGWRDWIAHDNRYTPAEEAAFRIDFAAWLASLPQRRRQTAELLAQGYGTFEVARCIGVTPAAVSQARCWLEKSWRAFQGESPTVCS